jgi:hypothetical protein
LDRIEVWLDGVPVGLPADRRSLEGIRCHLEAIAFKQQRFLGSIRVAGCSTVPQATSHHGGRDFQIQGFTMELGNRTLLILMTALEQTAKLTDRVNGAITGVLINEGPLAREIWWSLANALREPILTLSLLPDNVCGPNHGQASFTQLRKWQLEQLAAIIRDVEDAANSGDVSRLSDALAQHVMPWLESQREVIQLWIESAGLDPRGKVASAHVTT